MQTPFARGAAALPDKENLEEVGGRERLWRERENGKEDKGQGSPSSSNLSKWDLVASFLAASSLHPRCSAPASKEGRKKGGSLGWPEGPMGEK